MGRMRPLYDGIKLLLVITSDNHIDIRNSGGLYPMLQTRLSLTDSAAAAVRPDAYITVGDTTSRGQDTNWKLVEKTFGGVSPAERIFLTAGNHDMWHDDGFEAASANYLEYTNRICGTAHDKTYFSHEVNGYSLIFLGDTRDAGDDTHLGDEQLDWLGAELDLAGDGPSFVFCHQSLNGRHGLPMTWDRSSKDIGYMTGGIGEESDRVAAILKSHKNVFYFSGHSHMGLGGERCLREQGYCSVYEEEGVTLTNLPSLSCGNHHGEDRSQGIGMVVEVYDGRVLIRPRNFARRRWNTKVDMQAGKGYYEKKL